MEKIRKNRIKKCLDLINKLLWSCLPRNDPSLGLQLAIEFIKDEGNWKEALTRSEPWYITHALLSNIQSENLRKIAHYLLDNRSQLIYQIALLLSCEYLLPLQPLADIRKMFVGLKGMLHTSILALEEGVKK